MRIPPFHRFERLVQSAGIFTLGVLVGAILYNSIAQARFEALINMHSELETKLAQYEQEIQSLNQFKRQHTVIKSVEPRIEEEAGLKEVRPKLDKLTEAELKKRMIDDLSVFIGRNIYDIDTDAKLARKLLEKRIYYGVMGKDYTVEAKTMLVSDNKLLVWVIVRLYEKPPA
jgi:hypothetical protein